MSSKSMSPKDLLRWLLDEVKEKKKEGLLGETGPLVPEEHRDKVAEYIAKQIETAVELVDKLNCNVTSEIHSKNSSRGVMQMIFGYNLFKDDLTYLRRRLDQVAERTFETTNKTAHFREKYIIIYKAAFYAMLPAPGITQDVCIQNYDKLNGSPKSIFGLGMGTLQLRFARFGHLVKEMDLDAAYCLDSRLVSLSIRIASLLEIAWNNKDSFGPEICNVVYDAGRIYQSLLVASQGDVFLRRRILEILGDVSVIIQLLDLLLSEISRESTSFIDKLDFIVGPSASRQNLMTELQEKVTQSIDKLRCRVRLFVDNTTATGESEDDIELVDHEEPPQSNELESEIEQMTFDSVVRRLRLHPYLEKFNEATNHSDAFTGVSTREGSYAKVYKVKLAEERNLIRNGPLWSESCSIKLHWNFDKVAVKVVDVTQNESEGVLALRTLREFTAWRRMQHPNIIPLAGIWFNFKHAHGLPAFVSPWIEDGNLSIYLQKRADLDRKERLHILLGVAKALAYMHNSRPRVCHGDIKPDNILVERGNAFVCDFGISHSSAPSGLTTDPHGDWRYKAPEQLSGSAAWPTPQSDMYSFGLLSYIVLSNLVPWEDDKKTEGDRIMNPSMILPRPDAISTSDYDLLRYCWRYDPRLRVTANIAVAKLEELTAVAKFEELGLE